MDVPSDVERNWPMMTSVERSRLKRCHSESEVENVKDVGGSELVFCLSHLKTWVWVLGVRLLRATEDGSIAFHGFPMLSNR